MPIRPDPWGSGAVEIATRDGIILGSVGLAQAHSLAKHPAMRKQSSAGLGPVTVYSTHLGVGSSLSLLAFSATQSVQYEDIPYEDIHYADNDDDDDDDNADDIGDDSQVSDGEGDDNDDLMTNDDDHANAARVHLLVDCTSYGMQRSYSNTRNITF